MNEVGCSDDDGDGIFSNVDDCPDSPQKWTANENGCTVLELPISWTNSGYGNGRMDKVSDFSFQLWMVHSPSNQIGQVMTSTCFCSNTPIAMEIQTQTYSHQTLRQ